MLGQDPERARVGHHCDPEDTGTILRKAQSMLPQHCHMQAPGGTFNRVPRAITCCVHSQCPPGPAAPSFPPGVWGLDSPARGVGEAHKREVVA